MRVGTDLRCRKWRSDSAGCTVRRRRSSAPGTGRWHPETLSSTRTRSVRAAAAGRRSAGPTARPSGTRSCIRRPSRRRTPTTTRTSEEAAAATSAAVQSFAAWRRRSSGPEAGGLHGKRDNNIDRCNTISKMQKAPVIGEVILSRDERRPSNHFLLLKAEL